jgi:hypothetical protein
MGAKQTAVRRRLSSGTLQYIVLQILTDVSEELTLTSIIRVIITLMMATVNSSEMSVNI